MGASLLNDFFNSRVNVAVMLAPRSSLGLTNGDFISFFWFIWGIWQQMLQDISWYNLLSRSSNIESAASCYSDIQNCADTDSALNQQRLPWYKAHQYAGISWMTIEHNAQIGWYDKFQQWDY